MRRIESRVPEGAYAPGEQIKRNPGVVCLWTTREYKTFRDGKGGILFTVGDPFHIEWFCRGRSATRNEVMESIRTGYPILQQIAVEEGDEAVVDLQTAYKRALEYVPK
jgi:hypothetical protein